MENQDEDYGELSVTAQRSAWILSSAGVLPFCVLAIALAVDIKIFTDVADALTVYAAIILSFLGGIRWGVALTRAEGRSAETVFFLAILPALIGWASVLVGGASAFIILISAFLLQLVWDYGAWCTDVMREWFVKLRITITAVVVTSLLVAFFAVI